MEQAKKLKKPNQESDSKQLYQKKCFANTTINHLA